MKTVGMQEMGMDQEIENLSGLKFQLTKMEITIKR